MVDGLNRVGCRTMIHPVSASSGSYTSVELDTKGFRHLDILFYNGAIAADMTVLKLQSSDVTGSGFADVTGTAFAAADLPKTATSANTMRQWRIDLKGQKRFWNIVATVAGATVACAIAFLSQGEEWPDNITERGLQAELRLPA